MRIVMILLAAAAVGWAFDRLHVPGGTIVGAMIGAAAVSLFAGGDEVALPEPFVKGGFVVVGAAIGATVTRDFLADLRVVLVPAVAAAAAIIVAGLLIAVLLRLTGMAPEGVVLATSPGALSAVVAAATEQGTGAPVAVFHTVRIVLVLLSLPLLIRLSGG